MVEEDRRIDGDTIDVPLVRRLIAAQFPEGAGLPLARAQPDGWDNRTFRLGDGMKVRLFAGECRAAFRAAVPADDGEWARARGWALWKALITLVRHIEADPVEAARARRVLDAVIADHAAPDAVWRRNA